MKPMFGRDLKSSELLALHLVLAAIAAGIWVSNGTLVGTAAGAGFGALMMGTKFSGLISSRWLGELAEGAAVAVVLVVWVAKQALMGDDWEPTKVQEIAGPMLLVTFLAVLAWRGTAAAEPSGSPEEDELVADGAKKVVPGKEARRMPLNLVLAIGVAVLMCILAGLSSKRPDVFGSQRQALAAFVGHDLKAYRTKEGLEYVLAGYLHVHVDNLVNVSDDVATASLSVDVPLLSEYFNGRDLTKRSATNAYFTLPEDQRRSIRLEGSVRLERKGLGWVVASEDITTKMREVQSASLAGALDKAKTRQTELFSANILGVEEATTSTLPFVLALAMMLMSIAVAIVNPRRYYVPIAGAAFCCIFLAAPTLLLTAF